MKKLIIAFLLLAGGVHAEEIWYESANDAGGLIILTLEKCLRSKGETTLRQMYATGLGGETIWGCWNFWNDRVHVIYDSGKTYTYQPELFTRRTKP